MTDYETIKKSMGMHQINYAKLFGHILPGKTKFWHVVTLAAEAETAELLYNCQTRIALHHLLDAIKYPQRATTAQFVYNTMKNKGSKAWDAQYHCLKNKMVHFKFIGIKENIT